MYISIVFLPLIGAITAGLFGRFLGKTGAIIVTVCSVFLSSLFSFIVFYEVVLCHSVCSFKLFTWMESNLLMVSWGFLFDSLTATMLIVVTFVSSLVHLYSASYMSEDPHVPRFMSYLSLFTFFMLMLVTADNYVQMFLGWEGVGLASYLLINFWHTRIQANKAAMKAMIVNKIGDFGLSLGIAFIFFVFASFDFSVVFNLVPIFVNEEFIFLGFSVNKITLISLLLFVGAVGKSAQIGLHTWLPDAMEGPTPVSALIHAATMVTAGVFVILRSSPILEYSNFGLLIITVIGALTAFMAATIGVVQNDLKKVIAYSTCSQLGYMIFACGLSNYSVSMFHLMNHAYFKALLFLSAGSVIHALADEQDMRKMGGLVQILPMSYIMILIGSLALMGIPFLTGFYSKDVILEVAYVNYNFSGIISYWLGLLSAGFTSFYSFRLIYLTFLGNPNGFKNAMQNAHDAPFALGLPLFILGICSLFIGFTTKDLFIGLGTPFWNNAIYTLPEHIVIIDAEFLPPFIKWLPFFVSLLSASFAFYIYSYGLTTLVNFYKTTLGHDLYLFINRKWLFDKLQNELVTAALLRFGYHTTYKIIDKGIIELFGPVGLSTLVKKTSKSMGSLQSGLLNHYAFVMFIGLFIFLSCITLFTLFQIYIEIHLFVLLGLTLFLFTLIDSK